MSQVEIGGYFGIELNRGNEYHPDAIKLNSGRNCFKYIIMAQKPSKVYLPYIIDMGMTEDSLKKLTDLEFYHINQSFEIEDNLSLRDDERIVYLNYYSLKDEYIMHLYKQFGHKLIIDNTQSFYSKPLLGVDTFYSNDSKYFGVQSGGYLFTTQFLNIEFEQDYSYSRMNHLLGRIDCSAEEFYSFYKETMKQRYNQDIKLMSKLAQRILGSIDYTRAKIIRERNFYYLHSFLKNINELKFNDARLNGPFAYPFLLKHENLRKILIENKIYIPTYWKYILDLSNPSPWEKYLVKYLLPLPIDQRCEIDDMAKIVEVIKGEIGR